MSGVLAVSLLRGFDAVLAKASTVAEFHKRDTGAESPMSQTTPAVTDTTESVTCIVGMRNRRVEPGSQGDWERLPTVCCKVTAISRKPTKADRFTVQSVVYNVEDVDEAENVLYVIRLSGPSPATSTAADVTSPIMTPLTLVAGGDGVFQYTASANESVVHRVRYRRPPVFGSWTTAAYNGTYQTNISASVSGLLGGLYEVEIQGKDAAGNESAWTPMGNVQVTGSIQ